MSSQPSWLLHWPHEPIPLEDKPVYGHPELERPDYVTLKSILVKHPVKIDTSVDILDVGSGVDGEAIHKKSLTHEQLVAHVEEATLEPHAPRLEGSFDNTQVALHPSTIFYLIKHLGVCPIFLSSITITPWLLNTGNALFKTFKQDPNGQGSLSSVPLKSKEMHYTEGFFRYSVRGRPAHTWFKHDLEQGTSTYIIQSCPEGTKTNILRWAAAPSQDIRHHVLRPLVLETLIIDEVACNWSVGVVETAHKLLAYEHLRPDEYGDGLLNSAVHDLHNLSQHFYIMQEELNGIAEQLDYLIGVHNLLSSSDSIWLKLRGSTTKTSVNDSLSFLRSRTNNWHRWVHNWRERTNVRINLFFNLATTKIATETRKDSSSMKTMPFFQTTAEPSRSSPTGMSIAEGWWLYPAITIPLTVLVFVIWIVWMKNLKNGKIGLSAWLPYDSSWSPVNYFANAQQTLRTWWNQRKRRIDRNGEKDVDVESSFGLGPVLRDDIGDRDQTYDFEIQGASRPSSFDVDAGVTPPTQVFVTPAPPSAIPATPPPGSKDTTIGSALLGSFLSVATPPPSVEVMPTQPDSGQGTPEDPSQLMGPIQSTPRKKRINLITDSSFQEHARPRYDTQEGFKGTGMWARGRPLDGYLTYPPPNSYPHQPHFPQDGYFGSRQSQQPTPTPPRFLPPSPGTTRYVESPPETVDLKRTGTPPPHNRSGVRREGVGTASDTAIEEDRENISDTDTEEVQE
ncbi:hypothetical protein D9611_012667 [Ephemerocybe angulata]|uniref:Uncharacterized protein n=1 Tax=Ephemerocybe angulata TaxID=980116 RepID=A0A8H5BA11_9AGAR|nr:hypothetical protein D9611_012667 [Tulosesus angulatus]